MPFNCLNSDNLSNKYKERSVAEEFHYIIMQLKMINILKKMRETL